MARNTLRLMEKRERKLLPQLELYQNNFFEVQIDERNLKVYVADVRIANVSDSDNSIKELDLEVSFKGRNTEITSNVIVPAAKEPDPELLTSIGKHSEDVLSVPRHISAHDVAYGLVIFKIDSTILGDSIVEKYEFRLTDTHNMTSSFNVLAMIKHGQGARHPGGDSR